MRVEVNGVRLFCDVEGPGWAADGDGGLRERPTLILLHGAPGLADHSVFRGRISELAGVAQLLYLDLRGAGRSDAGTEESWTLEQWADDLVGLCEALGIEKPIVLGHSGGGMVAMAYAVRHPHHPSRIILANTQARLNLTRTLAAFERRGGAEARDAAARLLGGDIGGLEGYARLCMPLYSTRSPGVLSPVTPVVRPELAYSFHKAPDGTWLRMDLLDELQHVRCPTLVLGGEEDPICPIEDQEDIAAALPAERVRFERFPGCGHLLFVDAHDEVLESIRRFLRQDPRCPDVILP